MAEKKAFLLRVDPALWSELERWAADELRSVNGQVEFVLRDALRRRGGAGHAGGGVSDSAQRESGAKPRRP